MYYIYIIIIFTNEILNFVSNLYKKLKVRT